MEFDFIKILFIFLSVFHACLSEQNEFKGNILCLMPIPSPSHHVWNRALYSTLSTIGYNVTTLSIQTDNPANQKFPNLHYIQLENVYETLATTQNYDLIEFAKHSTYTSITHINGVFGTSDGITMQTKGLQSLLNYPRDFKFDLVLYDYTGIPGLLSVVMDRFGYPPLVGLTAFTNPPNTNSLVGGAPLASLVPYYNTELPQVMSFWERSKNLFFYLHDWRVRRALLKEAQMRAELIYGKKLPNLEKVESKASLVMVNTHPSMDLPQPLLPNVIEIGGMHIEEPKPVPQAIRHFIESGKKGAVLFSIGSTLRSAVIGQHRIDMFVNALARLPEYNFLWKFEEDGLEVPKNIMLQKWFSQNDILAHPNLKLFITHGGLLSSQEATWHGVPMLGVPFFGDQRANIKKATEAGVAEKLDLLTMTEDDIYQKVKKMLEDESYRQKMALRSSRFRDRPMHPLQEATWWCEYVLRHKGAPHLKSLAAVMGAPTLFMWDLVLVWLGLFLGGAFLVVLGLKKIFYPAEGQKSDRKGRSNFKSQKID